MKYRKTPSTKEYNVFLAICALMLLTSAMRLLSPEAKAPESMPQLSTTVSAPGPSPKLLPRETKPLSQEPSHNADTQDNESKPNSFLDVLTDNGAEYGALFIMRCMALLLLVVATACGTWRGCAAMATLFCFLIWL